MMKNNNNIDNKFPRRDGMKVPEGYFDNFAARMISSLPDRPELTDAAGSTVVRTTWQRLRPYVYMAAMFVGVWLMLKLFTIINVSAPVPFESNPVMAEAFSNDTFVNEYVISDINQWDLYDDLMDDGFYPDAFLDSIALSEMDVPAEFLN